VRNNDHRQAWPMIRNLGKREIHSQVISAGEWEEHFTKLFGTKDMWHANDPLHTLVIKDGILGADITEKEFTKAIKSMKNNKAPGIDVPPRNF